MNALRQPQPAPGDYYGMIYKGGFLLPLLTLIVLAILLWWFLRGRKSTK